MAFNPINFMQAPILRDDRVGSFADNLMKGLTTAFTMRQQQQQNERAQQEFDMNQALKQKQQEREDQAYQQSQDPLYKVNALESALLKSNLTEEQKQSLRNQVIHGSPLSPEQAHKYKMEESTIAKELSPEQKDLLIAQAEYYRSNTEKDVKDKLAAGGKNIEYLIGSVQELNPNLTRSQAREAITKYTSGDIELKDGTILQPLDVVTQSAFDILGKSVSDSSARNRLIQRQQAEAAIPVLDKYINEGLEPYKTTYKGKSSEQVLNYFSNSEADQIKKGKFLASQQLIFDKALDYTRMAGANPSVKLTQHLIEESPQRLSVNLGTLSPAARKSYSDFTRKALEEASEAMKKVKINASSFMMNNEDKKNEGVPENTPRRKFSHGKGWNK